jgi:predicted RecB family nuclease
MTVCGCGFAGLLLRAPEHAVVDNRKITLDILKGYLNCPYLAHLLLMRQEGIKSDYEIVFAELEQAVRVRVADRLRTQYSDQSLLTGVVVDRSTRSKGAPFILDGELSGDNYCIRVDGLKRVNGHSSLGDFHYIPLMCCGSRNTSRNERLLLEMVGLFLSRIQGFAPRTGIIYHGLQCAATTVRFTNGLRAAEELLHEVIRIQSGDTVPKLLLNPHCPACQFRTDCRTRAIEQDTLSLLRGLKEKDLKRYARKGLFTLTQLAHTFRPRRKGRRSSQRSRRRYHELQALAIRDKRVYVLGAPGIANRVVRIYLDLESNPI